MDSYFRFAGFARGDGAAGGQIVVHRKNCLFDEQTSTLFAANFSLAAKLLPSCVLQRRG
jgi:hypothetical protein